MKILVLKEARALETGYHYTNAAAVVGILSSGVMKATNRKVGLEQSRIFPSGLKDLLKDLLKPVKIFSKEERELAKKYKEITRRLNKAKEEIVKADSYEKMNFLDNKVKDYKKEIKKLEKSSDLNLSHLIKIMNQYISEDDLAYFKSHIKNSDSVTLKYALENNLIDKRIAFMIDVEKIKAESWDRDIIRRELGQASEEENNFGVRNSGDNMYKSKSWSYTRNTSPVHSVELRPELVRISLDIDKISQRQSVDSFAWRKVSKSDKKTELEERVIGDTPNIGKYIKSIDFPEEVFDNDSKYIVYKGSNYPEYSLKDLEKEIVLIKKTKQFPYSSIIKRLAEGTYELKPVKDYFINAIEDDLKTSKAKGVGIQLNVKNTQVKTLDSLIKFIENATCTSYIKKPEGKNKKKIINKLKIKIGTFKLNHSGNNKSWEYSIPKKMLEEIDDLMVFYKTGKLPDKVKSEKTVSGKKSNKEVTSKKNEKEMKSDKDKDKVKDKVIKQDSSGNISSQSDSKDTSIKPSVKFETGYISYDLAKTGLEKLGNHLGKIYIVGSEKNGKINWSNFLLSNNLDKDLEYVSSQLEKGETLKVILPKDLTSKMKRPPLRNQERAISQQLYLPDLVKLTHSNIGSVFFKTLEEFVAFIHHQFHSVNNFGKTLKIGICTGTGGITITIKKEVIGAKHTPDFC